MAGASPEAMKAASWVINMENGPERQRLYNGHMIRRRPKYTDSNIADDHSEADEWLIEEWNRATSVDSAQADDDDDPCCEECRAWRAGESHAV